ncbi:MAG: HEAT repeat domain-containing protein [Desulfosarcina sp.]|nr:HEAT repeat domain-containing protein [Desulfosarcina sp.]
MKFTRIIYSIWFLLILCLSGCENESEVNIVEKATIKSHKTIKIQNVTVNPVQHATKLLGINLKNMERPNSIEDGYHMVCRMPIIDKLKKSPFALQQWATEKSDEIQSRSYNSLKETLLCLLNTVNGSDYKYKYAPQFQVRKMTLVEAYRYLLRVTNEASNPNSEQLIFNSKLSDEFKNNLSKLILALADASLMTKSAFKNLSKEELIFLEKRPERYFFPNNLRFDFMTGPTDVQYKMVLINRKIDFDKLFEASILLSAAVDTFSENFKNTDETFFQNTTKSEDFDMPLFLPSPLGNIVVLGPGNDEFKGCSAILIDLGGNDKYLGQISTGHLTPGRISISIDRDGDDVYNSQSDRFGQGAGCLSVGILADLSGNDIYIAGDIAQGVGLYGVGLLIDHEGDDYYRMNVLGQGVGLFGIGNLIDNSGNDRYLINSLGQGVGSTMGIGLLCDREGDDKYIAKREETRGRLVAHKNWSHVQGAGLSIRSHKWRRHPSIYGGIGMLSDGAGDDFYYAEKGNCMGSSYFMSVGMLVDHGGDDKYIPESGYGISSAVHWTASAFVDKSGNDVYFGATQTGGVASDRSVAIMADYEGDDIYGPTPEYIRSLVLKEHEDKKNLNDKSIDLLINKKLADVSYGAAKKPNAVGVLVDYKGNDRYYAKNFGWGESCGGVMPPMEPKHWGHALLIDLNGNDFYSKAGRKNNHYHLYDNHGICYDTDYSGQHFFGLETQTYDPFKKNKTHTGEFKQNQNPDRSLIKLKNHNIFRRFSEYGKLVNSGESSVVEIADFLLHSIDNEINRDLTEILAEIVLKTDMSPLLAHNIENLLIAEDPYVRLFSARILGWWNSKRSKGAILDAIKSANYSDSPQRECSDLLWALGKVDQTENYTDLFADYAINDSNHQNRLEALLGLAHYAKNKSSLTNDESKHVLETLLSLIDDDDIIISAYAVKGLEFYGEDAHTLKELKRKMTSTDEYVKRFSAHALIRNGVKEAIPILIRSLTFPSIDTFEHYDHDLAKSLAFYCGVDFPVDTRHDYKTWQEWWDKNGSTVDLNKNLKIMHDIENAFGKENIEEGIRIFENLLLANPDNKVVQKRYLFFCNHWITYNLLTLPVKSRDIITKCIQLQMTMIRLDPENIKYQERLIFFENWLDKL